MLCYCPAAIAVVFGALLSSSSSLVLADTFNNNGTVSSGCGSRDLHGDCVVLRSCHQTPPSRSSLVNDGSFDLRVHAYVVANPKQQPPLHQLMVNVTWRPSFEVQCSNVSGFEVSIERLDGTAVSGHCYTVSFVPTLDILRSRPIVWFWSSSLFDFAGSYRIRVASLPKREQHECSASTVETMPEHPDQWTPELGANQQRDCADGAANSNAYRWVAAFSLVHVKPWQRTVDVQFVAAPGAYCLRAYELRLMLPSREIVQSLLIDQTQLHSVVVDNLTVVTVGNGTFSHVLPGSYAVGVIPIDRDHSNVCKCPVPGGLCSCSLAIRPDVLMPAVQLAATSSDHDGLNNSWALLSADGVPIVVTGSSSSSGLILFIVALLVFIPVVFVVGCLLLKRYRLNVKCSVQQYWLPAAPTLHSNKSSSPSAAADGKEGELLLLSSLGRFNILIVYAHDSPAHVDVVRSLVGWMQAAHPLVQVSVDYLCSSEIAVNKYDWMMSSIKAADRIVVVNSYGAFMRYRTKVMADCGGGGGGSTLVERKEADPMDDLFLGQLDLLIGQLFTATDGQLDAGRRLVSVRFRYTPLAMVLPPLAMFPCYELPSHVAHLADAVLRPIGGCYQQLTNSQPIGCQLADAVQRAATEIEADESWFSRTHWLKTALPAAAVVNDDQSMMDEKEAEEGEQQLQIDRRRADSEPIVSFEDSGFGSAKSSQSSSLLFGEQKQRRAQDLSVV